MDALLRSWLEGITLSCHICSLRMPDDIILFCPSKEETIRNYKRLLRCFEMISGLSINFDKSSLILVNCEQS